MIQETVVKIVTRMTELSVDDVKISKPETLGYAVYIPLRSGA